MTKFSDFIRMPGTAGPPTKQGIRDLGFALLSDFPDELEGYLSVLEAQGFTSPQRLQGRNNLGLGTIATQAANSVAITGGAITGITDLAIADGGTGASTAPAARTSLGLGNVDNTADSAKPVSTAQQAALDLKTNTDGSNLAAGFLTRLKWLSKAIGEYYFADDNVTGVDIPPISGTNGVWVELTAGLTGGGQFNNGKLTGESVSGSAPLVLATAVVSVVGSPMNGQTIRLLNTERRMLRAGSAGTIEADAMQQITGSVPEILTTNTTDQTNGALTLTAAANTAAYGSSSSPRRTISFDSANSPNARTATETRPKNIGVRIFRRVG